MVPQGKPPTTLVCTFQPQSQVGQPAGGHPGDANISAMLLKLFRNLAKHRISLCTACALVHSKALDYSLVPSLTTIPCSVPCPKKVITCGSEMDILVKPGIYSSSTTLLCCTGSLSKVQTFSLILKSTAKFLNFLNPGSILPRAVH